MKYDKRWGDLSHWSNYLSCLHFVIVSFSHLLLFHQMFSWKQFQKGLSFLFSQLEKKKSLSSLTSLFGIRIKKIKVKRKKSLKRIIFYFSKKKASKWHHGNLCELKDCNLSLHTCKWKKNNKIVIEYASLFKMRFHQKNKK